MKTIALKQTGYKVYGVADLKPWGGGNACISITPFHVQTLREKDLRAGINDAGFGVEKINGALLSIHKDFQGTERFFKIQKIGKVSQHTAAFFDNN